MESEVDYVFVKLKNGKRFLYKWKEFTRKMKETLEGDLEKKEYVM